MVNRLATRAASAAARMNARTQTDRSPRLVIWVGAIYACVVSLLFGLTNPPLQAPDEAAHLAYVNHLIEFRSLPNQLSRAEAVHGEGHQHPLYYIAAALLAGSTNSFSSIQLLERVPEASRVDTQVTSSHSFESQQDGVAFFTLRSFGALLLGLLVLQIGRLADTLRMDPTWPVLFACTLPQLLFISSAINNDVLVALLSCTAILSLMRWHRNRVENLPHSAFQILFCGVWAGAAFLTKKSALILLPAGVLLIIVLLAAKRRGELRVVKSSCAAATLIYFFLGWLLLAGPLLMRNYFIYGDPLANWVEAYTLSHLQTERSLLSPYFLSDFPMGVMSSFVGNFGWLSVQLPMRLVALYFMLIAPGLIASFRGLRSNLQMLYLWAITILSLSALIFYNLSYTQAQGRLLFPAIAAIACAWGYGMDSLFPSGIVRKRVLFAFATVLVLLDAYAVILNVRAYV
jgi:hypothetical protein